MFAVNTSTQTIFFTEKNLFRRLKQKETEETGKKSSQAMFLEVAQRKDTGNVHNFRDLLRLLHYT